MIPAPFALVKRLCLGALAGLVSAYWLSVHTSVLIAVAVLYGLLVLRAEPRMPWQRG